MSQILIDRVGRVSFHDGLVRIECLSVGPDGQAPSGTLLTSGAQAGKTLKALVVKSLQELQKKVQQQGIAGSA